jgi:hypothetical protein
LIEVDVGVIGIRKEAVAMSYQPLYLMKPLHREVMAAVPPSGHGRPVMARASPRRLHRSCWQPTPT